MQNSFSYIRVFTATWLFSIMFGLTIPLKICSNGAPMMCHRARVCLELFWFESLGDDRSYQIILLGTLYLIYAILSVTDVAEIHRTSLDVHFDCVSFVLVV